MSHSFSCFFFFFKVCAHVVALLSFLCPDTLSPCSASLTPWPKGRRASSAQRHRVGERERERGFVCRGPAHGSSRSLVFVAETGHDGERWSSETELARGVGACCRTILCALHYVISQKPALYTQTSPAPASYSQVLSLACLRRFLFLFFFFSCLGRTLAPKAGAYLVLPSWRLQHFTKEFVNKTLKARI